MSSYTEIEPGIVRLGVRTYRSGERPATGYGFCDDCSGECAAWCDEAAPSSERRTP